MENTESVMTLDVFDVGNAVETTRCCHHWLIEAPNGPMSKGICKYCSEEREFSNVPPLKQVEKRPRGRRGRKAAVGIVDFDLSSILFPEEVK